MDYKLAKELKDAGFLQDGTGKFIYDEENPSPFGEFANSQRHLGMKHFVKIPTLSELIDACGDRFDSLAKINSRWVARGYNYDDFEETPEEAVANLYLALNKK